MRDLLSDLNNYVWPAIAKCVKYSKWCQRSLASVRLRKLWILCLSDLLGYEKQRVIKCMACETRPIHTFLRFKVFLVQKHDILRFLVSFCTRFFLEKFPVTTFSVNLAKRKFLLHNLWCCWLPVMQSSRPKSWSWSWHPESWSWSIMVDEPSLMQTESNK